MVFNQAKISQETEKILIENLQQAPPHHPFYYNPEAEASVAQIQCQNNMVNASQTANYQSTVNNLQTQLQQLHQHPPSQQYCLPA